MTQVRAEALARHPSVEYVEQDAEVQASATQTNATWGLDRIDQRGGVLDRLYNITATGAGVTALYLHGRPNATPAEVNSAVVNSSTSVRISNGGRKSPNRLLYSLIP
jgi:hypothetical protein